MQGAFSGSRARGGSRVADTREAQGPPPSFTALPTSLGNSSGDNAVGGSGGGWRQFPRFRTWSKPTGTLPDQHRFSSLKRPDLALVVTGGSSILPSPRSPWGEDFSSPKPRTQNPSRISNLLKKIVRPLEARRRQLQQQNPRRTPCAKKMLDFVCADAYGESWRLEQWGRTLTNRVCCQCPAGCARQEKR